MDTSRLQKARRIPHLFTHVFCMTLLLSLFAACDSPQQTSANTHKSVLATATPSLNCTTHSTNPIILNMYYGSEKQAWMEDVVANFNSRHVTACDGPITVKATPVGSGESMQQILDGTIRPDIWSPAGSVWLNLLNAQWATKHAGATIVPTGANDAPPLVSSPVVIAMWKPEAEALGWPSKAIGWKDIADLSTNPRGWAAYGHPEWGDFKFGHTHPDDSNSGLDAVIAENYAAVNKLRGLTSNDVTNKQTQDFVANVESSVIHYGESTGFFADKMFQGGPGYLSAAVMYESLVVQANDGKTYPKLPMPVVAIYPKEGTFLSDHPFAVLQGSWMTDAKRTSALAFRAFLLSPEQQQKALQYGFRPANLSVPVASPIDTAHGVDPTQPRATLQIPGTDVVNAITSSWNQQRRKVDVMLILDRSGSMNDAIGGTSKIDGAKQGLSEFVHLLGDSDGLGITTFSTDMNTLTPVSPLGPKRQNVLDQINTITASGNTRLFNTIDDQFNILRSQPSKHIKAIVVLTDGNDTVNQMNINQLIRQIAPASGDKNAGEGVKIFTIAYGSDADVGALTRIANATGGQEYAGNPQNIQQVYQQISQFF